jgi:hypothetical protein
VVLVNPNGIVMGPTGRITASAFTASTFGIMDANFEAGHMKYERNGSTGQIVHRGHIQTAEAGGYVALIGADVNNQGTITTSQGAVVLAAADAVTLPSVSAINNVSVPLSRNVRLELNPDSFGSASVSNSGVIVTEGGQVLMRAAAVVDAVSQVANATVIQSGSIDTSGVQGGAVNILADQGRIRVSGNIKANSTDGSAGGDVYIGRDKDTNVLAAVGDASGAVIESEGGFVETSGDWLATYETKVKAKDWLLDPYNINIVGAASGTPYSDPNGFGGDYSYTPGAASNIRNTDIQNSLNEGTNVKISTGLGSSSSGTDVGNIYVGANIAKTLGSDATLTLEANNAITFGGGFKITGNSSLGKLNINLIANGGNIASNSSGGVFLAAGSGIDANGKVTVNSTTKYTGGWDWTRSALAMHAGSLIKADDIDIKLNVDFNNSASQYRVYGAFLQNNVQLEAKAGNLSIDSNLINNSKSNNSNSILAGSGYGAQSVLKASGEVKLTSDWSTNLVSTSTGVSIGGGISLVDTKVEAGRNILIDSKVSSDTISAIGGSYGGSGHGFSAVSTGNGDVTFTANKGGIGITGLTAKIKGNNVTIDNGTGASGSLNGILITSQGIDATGKIEIKGKALGSQAGVNAAGTYTTTGVSPDNTVYVEGTSATGNGVQIGTIGSPTALSTGAPVPNQAVVTINGTSLGGTGSGIAQTGAITAKSITMTGNSVGGAGVTGMGVLTATGDVHIEGTSTATTTKQGINVVNNITGSSVYLKGISGGSTGVDISAAVTSTSTGDITVIGDGGVAVDNTTYNQGVWVRSTGSIVSAAKATITGENSNGVSGNSEMMGARINGVVNAVGNIEIEGNSNNANTSSHGLVITNSVESTHGNVSVKAYNKNGEKVALLINGAGASLKAADGKIIDMIANTMDFSTASSVNATNGTVNIRSKEDGIAIKVGIDYTYPVAQQLRLNQTELNKITAGKTVIGHLDNAGAGNIEVSTSIPAGITTNAATGHITLQTGGNIDVKSNLSAASGQNLTLQAKGDVTVAAAISQAGSGNIVIAAGLGKAAGDGTGVGQIKGTGDVTHTGTGNTYIYTGEVATSAKMSDLNSTEFGTLTLGTNAQSNTDTDITKTITGSAAKTQVMYREKIAVDLNGNKALVKATKSYGEVANDADAQTALKAVNTPSAGKDLSWSQSGNNFKLNSNTLIDNLSVDAAEYSTAVKLKANDTAYNTKFKDYTFTSGSILPTLKIDKLALTGTITEGKTTYGEDLAAGTVSLNNKVGTDVVSATGVTITTTGKTSTSGNLKADTHTGIQSVTGLTGNDAENYTFADVKGDYTVDKRAATISATPTQLTFTGTTLNQAAPTTSNLVAGDDLTINGTASGVATGVYTSALAASGGDDSNYDFTYVNADLTITAETTPIPPGPVVPPTPPTPNNNTVVVAGGNNNFQLAGAEGTCSADTLDQCECETATNEAGAALDGLQICYEPKTRPSSAL